MKTSVTIAYVSVKIRTKCLPSIGIERRFSLPTDYCDLIVQLSINKTPPLDLDTLPCISHIRSALLQDRLQY